MTIQIINEVSFEDLEKRLRAVPLVGKSPEGKDILPYASARMEMREVWPDEANPIAFYLIQSSMAVQRREHAVKREGPGRGERRYEPGPMELAAPGG